MVLDLLQTPEVLDAQATRIQKDVFEVLVTSNYGHVQCVTPAFEVTATEETDTKRSHLDYPPICPDCVYEGDDRDVRCAMCGRGYTKIYVGAGQQAAEGDVLVSSTRSYEVRMATQ
eukprot:7645530-Pyramimonas_sp.AAC.1